MKKRKKNSFGGFSRNVLFALLVLAAAITVYGFAQAAVVSHAPSAISPQGAGSGLDADLLQGLTAADILSVGIPDGMISMFDTTCPEGWTRFAALDGRFPYGGVNYGATGGSNSHTHAAGSYTAASAGNHQHQVPYFQSGYWTSREKTPPFGYSGTTGSGASAGNPGGSLAGNRPLTSLTGAHTHTITGTSGSATTLPPYVTVVWCKKDSVSPHSTGEFYGNVYCGNSYRAYTFPTVTDEDCDSYCKQQYTAIPGIFGKVYGGCTNCRMDGVCQTCWGTTWCDNTDATNNPAEPTSNCGCFTP